MQVVKSKSQAYFEDASKILVGGVNSPVRAFKSVGGTPIFFEKASGALLTDVEGKTYIDYVLAWGPHLAGHAHPAVTEAIVKAAQNSTGFGAPAAGETECAKLIQHFYPHLEKIRFVNSGTEAAMSAIRLARGVTKRHYIVKFAGCYHGHADALLVSAGSGALTFGKPDSEGVLPDLAQYTVVINYNDPQALKDVFVTLGDKIAGVIVEPFAGNMGFIPPSTEFIQTLRTLCTKFGALLIFDEVMCGFRTQQGSAAERLQVTPDITILGKVIGGGLPCGAYGASKEIMAHISPEGAVYQAGTMSGNPIVMAAGIAMLSVLKSGDVFRQAAEKTTRLCQAIQEILYSKGKPYKLNWEGTMWSLFFTSADVTDLDSAKTSDCQAFNAYFHSMLTNGVYLPPSQFESCFVSSAHTEEQIEKTVEACRRSIL